MEDKCAELIASLRAKKIDYSITLFLQANERHEALAALAKLCRESGVEPRSEALLDAVDGELKTTGIRPITPSLFVTAMLKRDVIEKYRAKQAQWGIHVPFFFQTYSEQEGGGYANLVYYITRTWQDGLVRVLEILKSGHHVARQLQAVPAIGAFEHVLDQDTPFYPIFDCEIMRSFYKGRHTTDEIEESVRRFPQCLAQRLVETELVYPETLVYFNAKDKSRAASDGDFKVSKHFVASILATRREHHAANEAAMAPFHDFVHRHKKEPPADTELAAAPFVFLAWDFTAGKSNGVAMAFSRKRATDPFPEYIYTETTVCGASVARTRPEPPAPHDLHGAHLTDQQRLRVLYETCYTTPRRRTAAYACISCISTCISTRSAEEVLFSFTCTFH